MRKSLIFLAIFSALVVGAACSSSSKQVDVGGSDTGTTAPSATSPSPTSSGEKLGPTATMVTSEGTIKIEIDEKNAPKAAGRFEKLIREGFYNGLTFHRVVPDFVIQGGDPKGDGSGGTGQSVVGETPKDGYPLGSLAAAKTGSDPDGTFDCQFFIVTGDQGTQLPAQYARFGRVTSGMDVAKKIEGLAPPEGDGPPTKRVVIQKVTLS